MHLSTFQITFEKFWNVVMPFDDRRRVCPNLPFDEYRRVSPHFPPARMRGMCSAVSEPPADKHKKELDTADDAARQSPKARHTIGTQTSIQRERKP